MNNSRVFWCFTILNIPCGSPRWHNGGACPDDPARWRRNYTRASDLNYDECQHVAGQQPCWCNNRSVCTGPRWTVLHTWWVSFLQHLILFLNKWLTKYICTQLVMYYFLNATTHRQGHTHRAIRQTSIFKGILIFHPLQNEYFKNTLNEFWWKMENFSG